MTDAETGWYLRHRDGVEHGPFRFADIVAAAKLGNIATDTCVRHEARTLGQWVFAPRVQSIADEMNPSAPRTGPTRAAKTTSKMETVPKRASSSANLSTSTARLPETDAPAAVPNVEQTVWVRPHRDHGYPVPKTFANACIAFFDLSFRSFVTPWIVKILWALCIAAAILLSGKLFYEDFIQGEVPATSAASAIGATGEWQFEPLGDQPFLQSTFFRFLTILGAMFVALLCMRVVCETAIVLFRAASDLHELKTQGKE